MKLLCVVLVALLAFARQGIGQQATSPRDTLPLGLHWDMTSEQAAAQLRRMGVTEFQEISPQCVRAKGVPIGNRLGAAELLIQSWNAGFAIVMLTFRPAKEDRDMVARELLRGLAAKHGERAPGVPGEVGAIRWAINPGTRYEASVALVHNEKAQSIAVVYTIGKRITTGAAPRGTAGSL